MKTKFKEVQKFTQWWLWLILIVIFLIPIYGLYRQIIQNEKFGDKPISDKGLVIAAVISFTILILFWLTKLTTEINCNEFIFKFSPFYRKVVQWKDVKSAKVLNYGFAGGYGIRLFTKYGTVYNTRGNKGVAIELNDGTKFLVGTQKMKELKEVVQNVCKM